MQINNLIRIIMPKITRNVGIGLMTLVTCVQTMEPEVNIIPYDIACKIPEEIRAPVEKYYKSLPCLGVSMDGSSNDKAEAIFKMLEEMKPIRHKVLEITGQTKLIQKIKGLIDANSAINMITVGFPFKSSNHETKVIDEHIDMAEFAGFLTYEHICQEIRKIHPPGAQLIIYSDGCVYRELDQFNSYSVYQHNLEKLMEIFPSIKLGDAPSDVVINAQLDDSVDEETKTDMGYFMATELNCAVWKKILLKDCIKTISIISDIKKKNDSHIMIISIDNQEIKLCLPKDKMHFLDGIECIDNLVNKYFNDDFRETFKKSFMIIINQLMNAKSKDKIEELSQFSALSSKKFGNALKCEVPNYDEYIRLSVHPHINMSEKCGIGPIYGSKGTPWHGCPVLGNHGVMIMSKGDFLKKLGKNQDHEVFLKSTEINGVVLKYYGYDWEKFFSV